MNNDEGKPVGLMLNPPHLGELIRESMEEVGWNVTETAARLGCERGTLSRLLNGKAGVSVGAHRAARQMGRGIGNPALSSLSPPDPAEPPPRRCAPGLR